jgi:hypothetical protein
MGEDFDLKENSVQSWGLLNHLIRSREHIRWNRQADLLGGFQIDYELKLGWLLYRQVCGFRAF